MEGRYWFTTEHGSKCSSYYRWEFYFIDFTWNKVDWNTGQISE